MSGNSGVPGRSVIGKIGLILTTLRDGRAQTLTETAVGCGLPLSTVHRLLGELAMWGIVERDDDGRYRDRSTPKIAEDVGCEPSGGHRVRRLVAPVMHDLSRVTGAHIRAGFLTGADVAYVEKPARHSPLTLFSASALLPAHATSLGKILLAFSPGSTLGMVSQRGLKRYTPTTITRIEQLRFELHRARLAGVAYCDGELDARWRSVAAPVFARGGEVVAAIEMRVDDIADRSVFGVEALLLVATAGLSREPDASNTSTKRGRLACPIPKQSRLAWESSAVVRPG